MSTCAMRAHNKGDGILIRKAELTLDLTASEAESLRDIFEEERARTVVFFLENQGSGEEVLRPRRERFLRTEAIAQRLKLLTMSRHE